jgi:DNA topoisomerase-3
LSGQEWAIYNLISRHFLGSVSKDAIGNETTIKISIGGENFSVSGLIIESLNYLEVYTFDHWTDKFVPVFSEGETFIPSVLKMDKGSTSAPTPLTEADLITKMDVHGIGTDATIHEHIKTVQDRGYAVK